MSLKLVINEKTIKNRRLLLSNYLKNNNVGVLSENEVIFFKHIFEKFYTPDEFKFLYDQCVEIGFKMVSSSPLTRSSYHADEDFTKLKKVI